MLETASWTPRIEEMGGSPAVQKLELVSPGHLAAAHWVVHGVTPVSFVLQPTRLSTRPYALEEKVSGPTPSLSSWKISMSARSCRASARVATV